MNGVCATIFTTILLAGEPYQIVIAEEIGKLNSNELVFDIKPSEETGDIVERFQNAEVNPEELGNYFEGDIMMESEEAARQGLTGVQLWEGGVVPYVIDEAFSFNALTVLLWAMRNFHQKTCIRFKPKTDEDKDYIILTNNKTGCWSYVGRNGGAQQLNLQEPGCLHWSRRGTAVHELMHALGISHEHTRSDRDDFVDVLYNNVRPDRKFNFQKNTHAINQVMPYDYGSVMHYSMFAFGKKPTYFTLRPKVTNKLKKRKSYNFEMGQRFRMSHLDIMRMNALYCRSARKGLVFSIWNSVTNTMFPAQWK